MVQRAFRHLDFAKPQLRIQPEGNVTLVNLPTYYRVEWPAAGVSPTEVASVTILGMRVRIRPAAERYTYRFGDGSSSGPVADAGGTYPRGRIQHSYQQPATAAASVTARYTADFSVNGGPWQPVDDTVSVPGPTFAIDVREARNRLQAGHQS